MKPICPACGDRHEKHQAHVWRKVVVNADADVVVNKRSKDRHRNTPERREYIRLKMREMRKRRG
jgi:uncharacterized Zn finger protein (UPF0148 family)